MPISYWSLLATCLLVVCIVRGDNVDEQEIEALQNLYSATNGTGWDWVYPENATNGYIWDFTNTSNICDWQGVECDSTESHISELTLNSFSLAGTLPDTLSDLSLLQYLSLNSNLYLGGTIPASFSGFGTVSNFELASCNFSGPVPSSLAQMSSLRIFDVGSNQMTGYIPTELMALPTLERVRMFQNHFRGPLPETVGLPETLSYLSFYENSLTGTLPDSYGSYSLLVYLGLYSNQFVGPVPSSYGNLHRMQYFRTYDNSLTGSLPTELTGMTDALVIRMDQNHHTGPVPPYSSMPSIVYLNIESNHLSGVLPESLGNLSTLEYLYLDSNRIGGSIPSSYGNMTALKYFRMEDNKLTGKIPSSLGNLVNLEVFLVHINKLHGKLKDIFDPTTQTNLMNIDVSSNKFKGKIPEEMFQFPKLKTFSASVNCFGGKIPHTLCDATELEVLVLNGLKSGDGCPTEIFPGVEFSPPMKGHIPKCLWDLTNMTQIAIAGNGFAGNLKPPADDSRLRNLTLSGNQLTGTIPQKIQKWPFQSVKLDFNKLTGVWNHGLANFSSNETIMDLRVNRLSGDLPGPFEDGKKIRLLDGNVFACDTNLPTDDPDFTSYVCGSSALDSALLIYAYTIPACIVVVIVWIAVVCAYDRHFNDETEGKTGDGRFFESFFSSLRAHYRVVMVWYKTPEMMIDGDIHHTPSMQGLALPPHKSFDTMDDGQLAIRETTSSIPNALHIESSDNEDPSYGDGKDTSDRKPSAVESVGGQLEEMVEFNEMGDYIEFSVTMRKAVTWSGLVILIVCMPLYPALKSSINDGDASTSEYQYNWYVSALFLKGYGPAMILLCVWSLAVAAFLAAIWKLLNHVGARGADDAQKLSLKEYGIAFVLLIVNCAVVLVENYLFVLSQSGSYDASVKSACQVAKSVFDLVWAFLISTALRALYVDSDGEKDGAPAKDYSSIRIWLAVSIKLFNDILTPFLVSAVQDQSCLNKLLYPPDPISTSYTYTACTFFSYNVDTDVFSCTMYEPITPTPAEYTPAFVYNNACTNSILRSFIPAIMYSYCIATFIVPWATIVAPMQFELKKIPAQLQGIFMGMLFPEETETKRDELYDAELTVVNFMRDLSMFLTYGLTSPPLGLVIAFAMQFKSVMYQVLMGRFLSVKDWSRKVKNAAAMERACRYDEDGVMACLFIVVIVTAAFQGLIMFDVLNDGKPVEHSYWASVLIVVIALSSAIAFSTGRKKDTIVSHIKKAGPGGNDLQDKLLE